MSNRELTYLEFEKMFENDDIKNLKSALGRSRDRFVFQDLLYEKLSKCEDKEKIKKYINKDILGIDSEFDLILECFDESEIQQILIENKKIVKRELERIFLESKINAVELMSKVIEKDKEMIKFFLESLSMMSRDSKGKIKQVLEIIGRERIKEFLKSCYNEKKVKTIFTMIEDIDFLEECVFSKILMISDVQKIEILKLYGKKSETIYYKVIEKYKLFEQGFILHCLKEIGDKELILETLCNEQIYFEEEKKISTIIFCADTDFQKKCLREEKLRLTTIGKTIIICEIGEKSYAEKVIEDEILGLKAEDISFLKTFFEIGLEDYIETIKDMRTLLKTPKNSTKGIEIESNGKLDKYVIEIINRDELLAEEIRGEQKWKYAKDGSGIELISHVMDDDEKATNSIYYICNTLKEKGHKITEKDAAHVHIGTNILTNVQSYKNLLEMWFNLEKAMFLVCNKEGELPRKGAIENKEYATPRSKQLNDLIKSDKISFNENETIDKFIYKIRMEFGKFSSINLGNVGSKRGSTIEYRVANGTLDPEIWVQNINFFATFTQSAEALYQIQAKAEEERTEEEKQKLELFDKIKSKEASQTEKLESLLCIMLEDEEQRSIYRKRYKVNSELLEQKENQELKKKLEDQIADYFVGFDSIEMGEYCFNETDVNLEGTTRQTINKKKVQNKGKEY